MVLSTTRLSTDGTAVPLVVRHCVEVSTTMLRLEVCAMVSPASSTRSHAPCQVTLRVEPLTVMSAVAEKVIGWPLAERFTPVWVAVRLPSDPALNVTTTSPFRCTRPKGPVQSSKVTSTTSLLVGSLTRVTQPAGQSCVAVASSVAAVSGSTLLMFWKTMLPMLVDCAEAAVAASPSLATSASSALGAVLPLLPQAARIEVRARPRKERDTSFMGSLLKFVGEEE